MQRGEKGYGPSAIPHHVFVDRQGRIFRIQTGADPARLEAAARELAEKERP